MLNYFLIGLMINMVQKMHANAQNIPNSKTNFSFLARFQAIFSYIVTKHTAVTVAAVLESILSTWSVIMV